MVDELDDILKYQFNIGGTDFNFEIIKFSSIEEYNSYREDGDLAIFKDLFNDDTSITHIVGYFWDIIGEPKLPLNLGELVKTLEWLGKEYVIYNWPDVIFYEAENPKFHNIYSRLFDSFGYDNIRNINNHHLFTYRERVGKNIKENNDEI